MIEGQVGFKIAAGMLSLCHYGRASCSGHFKNEGENKMGESTAGRVGVIQKLA
jgi:hypothetical protein